MLNDEDLLISSAESTVSRVKNGWYSETINETTSNESLENFKNSVNEMIKATKTNITSVNNVLEEYTNLDYRKEVV